MGDTGQCYTIHPVATDNIPDFWQLDAAFECLRGSPMEVL